MRIEKDRVDVKMAIPGATLRLLGGFGDMGSRGGISAEYFSLASGVDTTPLFVGLDGNLCQCPHWGFVVKGKITTIDADGRRETVRDNDLFYWPPGHNVQVEEDAELIMFSPEKEHMNVIEHMKQKVGAAQAAS